MMMATEPSITETVAAIDRRIEKLQRLRAMLTEEFGGAAIPGLAQPVVAPNPATSMSSPADGSRRDVTQRRDAGPKPHQRSIPIAGPLYEDSDNDHENDQGPRETRKQALINFLREHGPMLRRDILEQSGIPAGTVSYELNDKDTFIRHDDGTWGVNE